MSEVYIDIEAQEMLVIHIPDCVSNMKLHNNDHWRVMYDGK